MSDICADLSRRLPSYLSDYYDSKANWNVPCKILPSVFCFSFSNSSRFAKSFVDRSFSLFRLFVTEHCLRCSQFASDERSDQRTESRRFTMSRWNFFLNFCRSTVNCRHDHSPVNTLCQRFVRRFDARQRVAEKRSRQKPRPFDPSSIRFYKLKIDKIFRHVFNDKAH